jgi:dolichyl-phosphate-mannose--protein O-mannosyl transferase
MSGTDSLRTRAPGAFLGPNGIKTAHLLLFGILVIATFTRFWRLDKPDRCYFDEVYFPTTAAEILKGKDAAWGFIGHENTHPPLSKEIMALGEFIFGTRDPKGVDTGCWGDAEDEDRRNDPDWNYKPLGWRFFGAVASVGSVLFMYLLAKRLFKSEVAALASAAFLTMDGLALAQGRIGTPDTYVLFFVLGTLYFLVSERFLWSGLFLGAAAASKWIGAFTLGPIILFLLIKLIRDIHETRIDAPLKRPLDAMAAGAIAGLAVSAAGFFASFLVGLLIVIPVAVFLAVIAFIDLRELKEPDERLRVLERTMLSGLAALAGGVPFALYGAFIGDGFGDAALHGIPALLTFFASVVIACAAVVVFRDLWRLPRGRIYVQMALIFPVFFLMVPGYVYAMTYIPMVLNNHSVGDVYDLNKDAYEFHSTCEPPGCAHGYSSNFIKWPIIKRPIYLYVDQSGTAKIYSMGNPAVWWLGIPALVFVLMQGLKFRMRLDPDTGGTRFAGGISLANWPLLFVVASYLALWLPWATQPRTLFLYHYLPALIFVILSLGYCVHRLWDSGEQWGRTAAIAIVALATVTFIYFYPHWTALDVSQALDESYYWFASWR